jgi:hypothetical protein
LAFHCKCSRQWITFAEEVAGEGLTAGEGGLYRSFKNDNASNKFNTFAGILVAVVFVVEKSSNQQLQWQLLLLLPQLLR